jgi:hypothetical protein
MILRAFIFFAQEPLPIEENLSFWQKLDDTARELFAVLGSLIFISLLVFAWAVFVRKRRRRRERRHRHQHAHPPAATPAAATPERGWRKRRRRRREHRPRNPTLAEIGGLPPIRSEKTDDSYL